MSPSTYWVSLADTELTVDNVQRTLDEISDDLWVSAASIDRVVNDVDVQKTLLHIGISRTHTAIERTKASTSQGSIRDDSQENSDAGQQHNLLVAHFRQFPVDAQLCHIRSVLLERLDLLNTFIAMCQVLTESQKDDMEEDLQEWEDDPWADEVAVSTANRETGVTVEPPVSLSEFLTGDLLDVSCLLASLQMIRPLHILFHRHLPKLWPYRLALLQFIPEHVHPLQLRDFLPTFNVSTNSEAIASSEGWRSEQDYSERPEVQSAVNECVTTFRAQHLAGTHHEMEACPASLTADEISAWYENRVDRILSSTGMVDIALATIQVGASQGISGLDELGEELSLLSRLVYDAPHGSYTEDDWTLTRWKSMDPPAVIRAYLSHSTPSSLANDISRLVMPYLFVLESRAERAGEPDPSLPTRLLYDYVLSVSLEMASAVFEASKPTLSAAQRLIRSDEDLARLALACLYGSDCLDQWSTMSRIFECLPAWDVTAGEDEDAADTTVASLGAFVTPSTARPRCTASDLLLFFKPLPVAALSRALDILDVHLESGEILSRWSVPAPLRWFLQSSANANEQRAWANRMARRAGGTGDKLITQEDWNWLLEDMLKLSGKGDNVRGAFGHLTRDEVLRIFFAGLLSSGQFNIAQLLLHSPQSNLTLDSTTIEEICLSCSREFYDNSSSGNYKFGDMKLAYDCLDVPQPSDRLLAEKEFIEATSRISSFNVTSRPGIPISPIEVRLTKDRLSLVSRVLSTNTDAYKHTEVILDLVYKLGFREDAVAEIKTLAMLADTALQLEDFKRAYDISERMVGSVFKLQSHASPRLDDSKIKEASEVCWVACFQLGRQTEFDNTEKKRLLLGRAMEFCPAEKLHDILTAWRRLEKDDIAAREERTSIHRSGTGLASGARKLITVPASLNAASSLKARLQDFHVPSPPLLSTPDAAALASRTFKSVTANFPFSVGSRGKSQISEKDDPWSGSGSQGRLDGEDVSAQATRAFQKGIGWLIGADD